METSDLELLAALLRGERLLTLAVVVEGEPVAGVLPFLAEDGLQSLLVHSSALARHSRGLAPGSRYAAAIHRPLSPGDDPLRAQRLLVEGTVEEVKEAEREAIATAWVAAYPSAGMTVGLGDFVFSRLRIEGGRLVAGFARASGLSASVLAEAAALDG